MHCSGVDVYTALAGAVGALYGPLHGGANEVGYRVMGQNGIYSNVRGSKQIVLSFHLFVLVS